jgi:hypothetical protein
VAEYPLTPPGAMTVMTTLGNTIGVAITLPFVSELRSIGWQARLYPYYLYHNADIQVPVGIQFLPAVGILLMVPFCPGES